MAIYDAGAALCRSIGKTNVTMNVSIAVNIINVIGNCVGVFSLTPLIVCYSAISPEAKELVIWLDWGAIFIWRLKSQK